MENSGVAFVATIVLIALANPASAESWLSDRDLHYVFAGREVKGDYSNGVAFSEIYHMDGSVDYLEGANRISGEWKISGNEFCTDYAKMPGGCFRITSSGRNCFQYWLMTKAEEPKTWIARAWQTRYPPTCPKQ
jgi:hypothetical protein